MSVDGKVPKKKLKLKMIKPKEENKAVKNSQWEESIRKKAEEDTRKLLK